MICPLCGSEVKQCDKCKTFSCTGCGNTWGYDAREWEETGVSVQVPDIQHLEQILEHIESAEKLVEEMMITSAVENTIVTHLSELKESVLSQLKLLIGYQYLASKEASG